MNKRNPTTKNSFKILKPNNKHLAKNSILYKHKKDLIPKSEKIELLRNRFTKLYDFNYLYLFIN